MAYKKGKNSILYKITGRCSWRSLLLYFLQHPRARFALSVIVFFAITLIFFAEHLVKASIIAIMQAVFVSVISSILAGNIKHKGSGSYKEIKSLLSSIENRTRIKTTQVKSRRKTKKRASKRGTKSRIRLVVMEFDED